MLRALALISCCAAASAPLGLLVAAEVADVLAPGSWSTVPYVLLGALIATAMGSGLAGFALGRFGPRLKAGRVAAAALLLGAWPLIRFFA